MQTCPISVLALAATTLLPAQQPTEDALQTEAVQRSAVSPEDAAEAHLAPALAADPGAFLVPVHTAAADPEGGPYGLWAAGPDYKVAFGDGVVFYPVLGDAAPENLPLAWRTESIGLGDATLLAATDRPELHHTDWRVELRHGAVTEAYDVRRDGVEQTFVVHRRPTASGDLVIVGRVTTPLRAAPLESRHAAVSFADAEGRAIVRYGAAVAFDASGRRAAMRTSFDGERIRLELDGAWLAAAAFPVTVDPLIDTTVISTWGGGSFGTPSFPDVARDDETNELLFSYSRASSASDHDTWCRLTADDFSGSQIVYSDITASWSTRYNQVAFVSGAAMASAADSGRWVVALQRDFTSGACRVRVYIHDKGVRTLNSGVTLFHSRGATAHQRFPSVGGTLGFTIGSRALLVYQDDDTGSATNCFDTANSRVYGVTVECNAGAEGFGTARHLESVGGDLDAHWPCVNQVSAGGSDPWIVVWQSFNNGIAGDDWDLVARRVRADGTLAERAFFGPPGDSNHKVRPKVAGLAGRYLTTYTLRDNDDIKTMLAWGDRLEAHRFDWPVAAAAPTKRNIGGFAAARQAILTTGDGNRGVAYDNWTDSHWCVAYHTNTWDVHVARIGYDAGVAEAAVAYNGPGNAFSPSCLFDDDNQEFVIVYASDAGAPTGQPIEAARLTYAAASQDYYGNACGGVIIGTNHGVRREPFAGSEFYGVELIGAPGNVPAALWISLAPANIDLTPAGAPGCSLLIDPGAAFLVGLGFTTSATGTGSFSIPLVSANFDAYLQFGYLNAARVLRTTRGLHLRVR